MRKSDIAEYFHKSSHDTLFVVPTNNPSQEKDNAAIILSKRFTVPTETGDALPESNHCSYTVLVFDAVYMASMYMLQKMWLLFIIPKGL